MHSFDEYKDIVNKHLFDYLADTYSFSDVLRESMAYSLKVGGKRIRPVLLLAACEYAGGNIKDAVPFACSLEYIHTYSLIHDDLPAMDNDDYRRGEPTNHKVYGEDMAVLAGDGLLSTAAEVMTAEILNNSDNHEKMLNCAKAAHTILERAGSNGMIAGQVADVRNQYDEATPALVKFIEEHKTADLIVAPVLAGLALAGADDNLTSKFETFALNLGVAFQVSDDILDFEGDAETLGKGVGKDKDLGKCNYACVHGVDEAKAELHRLTAEAKNALADLGDDAKFFTDLADTLEIRKA